MKRFKLKMLYKEERGVSPPSKTAYTQQKQGKSRRTSPVSVTPLHPANYRTISIFIPVDGVTVGVGRTATGAAAAGGAAGVAVVPEPSAP